MVGSERCTRHPENPTNGIRCSACLRPYCRQCVDARDTFFVCRECRPPAEPGAPSRLEAKAPEGALPIPAAALTPTDPLIPDVSPAAPLGLRTLALIFDVLLLSFVVSFVESLTRPSDDSWKLWRVLALTIGYEAMFVQERGQTLGKLVAGVEVVALDGSRATPHQAWLRAFVKAAQLGCCAASFLLAPLRADCRGIHDLVAGTKVVRNTKGRGE